MAMHVLLVENNELDQSESLLASLESQGHNVSVVHTPETAIAKTKTLWPNLVIFNSADNNLKLPGFQEAFSQTDLNIPCLIVGDQSDLTVQINSDAILIAPHQPHQLTQGIKRVASEQGDRFIRLSNLIIDCQEYQLLRSGTCYALTPKEFKLLHLLVSHHDQVLSRKTIMQEVWETDYMGDTRTLDVHIRWIREKIEEDPSRPRRLITVRGVGYRFITEPE